MTGTLDDVLRDLDDDGVGEILLRRPTSSYASARCMALVPAIHKCSASECVLATERVPELLRAELQRRINAILEFKATPPDTLDDGADWNTMGSLISVACAALIEPPDFGPPSRG
jgi:hypothetical protein